MKSPANVTLRELEKIADKASEEADREARAAGIRPLGINAGGPGGAARTGTARKSGKQAKTVSGKTKLSR